MGVNGVPWWYFYKLAGPYEGLRLKSLDPDDLPMARDRAGARHRLRRVPGRRGRGTRRRGARRGRPLHARRAGRQPQRAGPRFSAGPDRRRLQGAGASPDPGRDLDQALGQPVLQPDQRPDARDPRRDRPRSRHARGREGHDAGGAGDRGAARGQVPDRCRPPDRRRRRGRRPQDLDAPGPRARPARWRSMASSAPSRNWARSQESPTPTIDTVLALLRLRAAQSSL